MNLQGIVAVSGKPGLWRALAQNKTGYILESLDSQKTKLVANLSTAKIAALNEITLFGLEEDIKLIDVFERMKTASAVPDAKADGKKLREFFWEVAPDHDEEKVYASDMKKVITWFQLLKDMPLFTEEAPAAPTPDENTVTEETDTASETSTSQQAVVVAEEKSVQPLKKAASAKKPAKPAEASAPVEENMLKPMTKARKAATKKA